MSSHIRDQLVGKSFEASIGEPWDFYSDAGQNKLTGMVSAVSEESSDVDWLLLEVSPFQFQKNEIRQVVGVNRYKSSQDVFGELLSGNITTLNFMFMIDGHELSDDTLLTELNNESNFSFLVGSVNSIG